MGLGFWARSLLCGVTQSIPPPVIAIQSAVASLGLLLVEVSKLVEDLWSRWLDRDPIGRALMHIG